MIKFLVSLIIIGYFFIMFVVPVWIKGNSEEFKVWVYWDTNSPCEYWAKEPIDTSKLHNFQFMCNVILEETTETAPHIKKSHDDLKKEYKNVKESHVFPKIGDIAGVIYDSTGMHNYKVIDVIAHQN